MPTPHVKPRMVASVHDPRCIDLQSGLLIGAAFDAHRDKTGETIPVISEKVGIGKESLRGYQRGHQVPTDASRQKLETYLGLEHGALKPKPDNRLDLSKAVTTHTIEGDDLVITTRIPLAQLG